MYTYAVVKLNEQAPEKVWEIFQVLNYHVYHEYTFRTKDTDNVYEMLEFDRDEQTLYLKSKSVNKEELLALSFVVDVQVYEQNILTKKHAKMTKINEKGHLVLDPDCPDDQRWLED